MPKKILCNLQDKVLTFNQEKHEYFVNGEIIPSVTQIIKKVLNLSTDHIPLEILEKARERGVKIHEDVEHNTKITIEGKWVLKQIEHKKCKFEKAFFYEFDNVFFAGTADIISENTLYDVKSQSKKDLLYWTLQLNFYNLFFKKKELKILYVPKTGNYEIINIPFLSYEDIKKVITSYLNGDVLQANFLENAMSQKNEIEPINLELKIYEQDIGKLTTNALELQSQVRSQLKKYNADFYTEDTIESAKKDKAELNKASKALNDKRIEIEKAFMKPIEEFKQIINDTIKEIKTSSSKIDDIVKMVEDRAKEQKREIIQEYFNDFNFSIVNLSQIFNKKWENKTFKIEDVKEELKQKIESIKKDLLVLEKLDEVQAKSFYLESLDFKKAVEMAEKLKENKKRLELYEVENEIQKKEENNENLEYQKDNTKYVAEEKNEVQEKNEYTVSFVVTASEEKLKLLQNFMDKNYINYDFR